MRVFLRIPLLLSLIVPVLSLPMSGEEIRLRVSAGDYDRRESIVTFTFEGDPTGVWVVRAEDGEAELPVQMLEGGKAAFILRDDIAAGESVDFILMNTGESVSEHPKVEVSREDERLRMSVGDTPALFYQAEERPFPRERLNPRIMRGGFLHPVISPSGKVVSQSYPRLHPHHQGIWTAWTRTRFEERDIDFWNMHNGTGKVEFKSLEETWSGEVAGGFRSRHQHLDLSGDAPLAALDETWTVTLFQVGTRDELYRLFDLVIFQEPAGQSPLSLPEYHYGGLGFRGPDQWVGGDRTSFLTSEGETDRVAANGSRTRWTHVSGLVDGEQAGVAILGHPDNFRAPQPVRLHPTEPFFCFAPSQLGDWEITEAEPYRAHYRFVVTDGEPNVELIERLWNDFAHPPEVEIL